MNDRILTDQSTASSARLNTSQTVLHKLHYLRPVQLKELINESQELLSKVHTSSQPPFWKKSPTLSFSWIGLLHMWKPGSNPSLEKSVTVPNKSFDIVSKKFGITSNVLNFPHLSLCTMRYSHLFIFLNYRQLVKPVQ